MDARQKKFNCLPVIPTISQKEPFGENIEGLFCLNYRLFSDVGAELKSLRFGTGYFRAFGVTYCADCPFDSSNV
jgi:hypothetical protein